MDLLRISATGHGINYLPQYLAARSGIFARLGLEVQAWDHDPWDGVIADLDAGRTDLVLGGVWATAMYAGTGRDLVSVGQVNARFPKVIVTREPVDGFTWEWMAGRTVLVPGQGGTAGYEYPAGLMREAGADLGATRFVRDLSTGMLREMYEGGLGDAIFADPMTASSLVRAGHGHASFRIADVCGPMANSVYYTDRSRLDEVHDRAVRFMAGIAEAMEELEGGLDPAELIAAEWPGGDHEVLLEAATTMAADGTWSGTRIDPGGLDRWAGFLHEGGLSQKHATYDELVDVRVADAVDALRATAVTSGGTAS